MDRIVAPIKPEDNGPAVANLQQAMLFIVEKRQLTPANRTLASWKDSVSGEISNQFFGQRTLQLLLALLPALHLPGADFVTPPVADALNKVLQDLGAFAPVPPLFRPVVKWEYKVYSWKQPGGVLFRGAGAIPTDEIAASLDKLGNEGWEAVSVFPIAMAEGATNMVGILLKRAVPNDKFTAPLRSPPAQR